MSGFIGQQLVTENEDGTGTITVVATDENGRDHVSTRSYGGYWDDSKTVATEKATQEALDKC